MRKRGKEGGNWFLSMHSKGEGGGGGAGQLGHLTRTPDHPVRCLAAHSIM